MIPAKELERISELVDFKRNDVNPLTKMVIEEIEKDQKFNAETFGVSTVCVNIGKTSIKNRNSEFTYDSYVLEESSIRYYFYDLLGFKVRFANIGTIEDKSIIVSIP